jgi:surfeit locus 1 family protein
MRIRFQQFEFTPSVLMLFISAIFFCLFVLLGNWQLQRADQKREIEQRFQQRLSQPAEYLYLNEKVNDELIYRRIQLKGKYDVDHILLLDNQMHQGNVGYHVLMPFMIDRQKLAVWVDRGWVAADYDRRVLPQIRPPKVDDRVEGVLTLPSTQGFRLGEVQMTTNWPQRIPYLNMPEINKALAFKLLPYVIWQDATMDDFYIREWKPVWSPPEKSEAYALQWFSFAVIVLLLLVVLNTKKIKRESVNE